MKYAIRDAYRLVARLLYLPIFLQNCSWLWKCLIFYFQCLIKSDTFKTAEKNQVNGVGSNLFSRSFVAEFSEKLPCKMTSTHD